MEKLRSQKDPEHASALEKDPAQKATLAKGDHRATSRSADVVGCVLCRECYARRRDEVGHRRLLRLVSGVALTNHSRRRCPGLFVLPSCIAPLECSQRAEGSMSRRFTFLKTCLFLNNERVHSLEDPIRHEPRKSPSHPECRPGERRLTTSRPAADVPGSVLKRVKTLRKGGGPKASSGKMWDSQPRTASRLHAVESAANMRLTILAIAVIATLATASASKPKRQVQYQPGGSRGSSAAPHDGYQQQQPQAQSFRPQVSAPPQQGYDPNVYQPQQQAQPRRQTVQSFGGGLARPQQQRPQQQDNRQQTQSEEEEEEQKPNPLTLLLEKSTFTCSGKTDGYYSDNSVDCQVFHYCVAGAKHSWMCPEGTVFHQVHLNCVPASQDICNTAEKFFFVNDYLHKELESRGPNNTVQYAQRYYPDGYVLGDPFTVPSGGQPQPQAPQQQYQEPRQQPQPQPRQRFRPEQAPRGPPAGFQQYQPQPPSYTAQASLTLHWAHRSTHWHAACRAPL
ncbi:hypothetical protein HPB47_028155 [Ixodes persulcatus]|uniref:Uncharacterized protein n=1 Tax=Ixodes persulcatus TaxID=34615 RepID=A0AC60PTZ3_IXOPE|nr:hypothetical protein HPB47_028155 [Ixodes persulcatus]